MISVSPSACGLPTIRIRYILRSFGLIGFPLCRLPFLLPISHFSSPFRLISFRFASLRRRRLRFVCRPSSRVVLVVLVVLGGLFLFRFGTNRQYEGKPKCV